MFKQESKSRRIKETLTNDSSLENISIENATYLTKYRKRRTVMKI